MANPNIVNVTSIYGNTSYLIPSAASVTGSIATTTLTVTAVASGAIAPSHFITGTGVTTNTYVTGQLTSTSTAIVTATFTQASTGVNTIVLSTYTVGTSASVLVGQFVQPVSGIPAGTYVTAFNPTTNTITISNITTGAVSGSASLYTAGQAGTYSVSNSQTVTSTTITLGGMIWTALTPAVGTVNKIDNIVASNINASSAALITVAINSLAGGLGTNYRLIYQLPVPVNASVVIVDKSTAFYLGETQSIVVTSGTANAIEMTASYEAIT
jgi:hypothetical protein